MIRKEHRWQKTQRDIVFSANVNNAAYNPLTGGIKLKEIATDWDSTATPQLYEDGSVMVIEYLNPGDFKRLQICGGVGDYFTMRNDEIIFLPTLKEQPFKCSLVYESRYPVISGSGDYKAKIDKDDDEPVFEDELVILASIYKWKQEMGYDYADAMADYQRRLDKAKNQDIIAPKIYGLSKTGGRRAPNIPRSIPAED
jgi:hypothetical protein